MATRCDAATVERARVLIETSVRTLEDIAVEAGVSVQSLRTWIKARGWRRHPQAPRAMPKLPPEKEEPARRVFENRASVADLAVLLSCHESYVHRLAKQRGWRRPGVAADWPDAAAEDTGPGREAREAIAARLREPGLSRDELVRLMERGLAVMLVEVIASPDVRIERRSAALAQLARLAADLPDDPPAPRTLSPEEQERESAELIEEIVRRFSAPGPSDADEGGAAS
ncbi:MAG TPA: hypothetical protein VF601_20855 [Beijerinckiaceae bacterium]|jgi:hypothetical protein